MKECLNCDNNCNADNDYCKECEESGVCLSCNCRLSGFEHIYCMNCENSFEEDLKPVLSNYSSVIDYTKAYIQYLENAYSYDTDLLIAELKYQSDLHFWTVLHYLDNLNADNVKYLKVISGSSKGLGNELLLNHYGNFDSSSPILLSISRSISDDLLYLCDNNYLKADKLSKNIVVYYHGYDLFCIHFYCDLSIESSFIELNNFISKGDYKIVEYVGCHGTIFSGGFDGESVSDFESSLNVNLISYYRIIKFLVPYMGSRSNITLISSISSSRGSLTSLSYSVSKAGLDMLVQNLALNLGSKGIRVNSINPGIFDSGFQVNNDVMNESEYSDFLVSQISNYPIGRLGHTSDIVKLVDYLSSADWVTGVNYVIDGGRLLK